jgi:integrase
LIETNPVASVQRPKVERRRWRILEPHEVPRVANAFTDDRARRAFLTLMLTGLRRFVLVALRWGHVNLVEATLRVVESKWEEGERLVALPGVGVDELAAHYTTSKYRSDADFVFCHPERGSMLDHDWYRDRFLEALPVAGIEGHIRAFHDMRHRALTNLAATGASPIAVMATAGHRSMQTTKQIRPPGRRRLPGRGRRQRRLLGVQDPGTNPAEPASLSENA